MSDEEKERRLKELGLEQSDVERLCRLIRTLHELDLKQQQARELAETQKSSPE